MTHSFSFPICTRNSAGRQILVGRDRPFEVVEFVAADEADVLKRREMLFGCGPLANDKGGLAKMFVRAAMTRIERERLLIMPNRRSELPEAPIRIADIVLDIRIAWIAQRRRLEHGDRRI